MSDFDHDPVKDLFNSEREQIVPQHGNDSHWQSIVRRARAQRRSRFLGYAAGMTAAGLVIGGVTYGAFLHNDTALVPAAKNSAEHSRATKTPPASATSTSPSPTSQQATPRPAPTTRITRKDTVTGASTVGFDHWGPIKLGMTPSQAAHTLGAKVTNHGGYSGSECFQPQLAGPSGAMTFMVEGVTWDGPIVRFDVDGPNSRSTRPGGPRTDTGVGIGSSSAQVKAAYPGRVKVSAHTYVPRGHYLEVLAGRGDPAGTAIVFETDETGRVTSMRWGSRQQAEYIEGCF